MYDLDSYLDESRLTEEEKTEVQKIVNRYDALDMNVFIRRVGGPGAIEKMRRINEVSDWIHVDNGNIHMRSDSQRENLDEWKKGFMEGFEEAYKRYNNIK